MVLGLLEERAHRRRRRRAGLELGGWPGTHRLASPRARRDIRRARRGDGERFRRCILFGIRIFAILRHSLPFPASIRARGVRGELVRVLGEVEVGHGVESFLPHRLGVVRHSRVFFGVEQTEVAVLLPDELSDASFPPAFLVPRHAAVLGRAFGEPFALSAQGQNELFLVHVRDPAQFLRVILHAEVSHRVVAAALHGGDVVRQSRLVFGVETAEVHLFAVFPDVRLPPARAAVVRHTTELRRAPRAAAHMRADAADARNAAGLLRGDAEIPRGSRAAPLGARRAPRARRGRRVRRRAGRRGPRKRAAEISYMPWVWVLRAIALTAISLTAVSLTAAGRVCRLPSRVGEGSVRRPPGGVAVELGGEFGVVRGGRVRRREEPAAHARVLVRGVRVRWRRVLEVEPVATEGVRFAREKLFPQNIFPRRRRLETLDSLGTRRRVLAESRLMRLMRFSACGGERIGSDALPIDHRAYARRRLGEGVRGAAERVAEPGAGAGKPVENRRGESRGGGGVAGGVVERLEHLGVREGRQRVVDM